MKGVFRKIVSAIALICMLSACFIPCFNAYALASKNSVYLSDMTPITETTGWGKVTYDRDLSGNPINIGGSLYLEGISVHANSVVEYDINGMGYEKFSAVIGVSRAAGNGTPDQSSVVFEVLADGVSLYKSGVKRYYDEAEEISVDIPFYTEKLTLKVTNADDGGNGDHASWAEAKLSKGKYLSTDLESVELFQENNELKIGDVSKLGLRAFSHGGDELDISTLDVEYFTETPQMIEIDADGNMKILANGIGTVGVTVTQRGAQRDIERRAKLTVTSNISAQGRFDTVLSSPSGNLEAKLYTDELGRIYYTVKVDGCLMLKDSAIGLSTTDVDLDSGLTLVSSAASVIDETYENITGKVKTARNHANVIVATFEKNEYVFILEFRAYDDGFAYRYTVNSKNDSVSTVNIDDETGYFSLPADAKAFYQKIKNMGAAFNYEENYVESTVTEMTNSNVAFPLLFSADDEHWMLLSEAELYGDRYVGSALYAESDGVLGLTFAPQTKDGVTVSTALSFTSPWRCGIAGGLDDIVESDLIEDLSARRDIKKFSWVKPGVASWLWLEEGSAVHSDRERIQDYIDLSAEMGWEYVLLDAGWQPDAPWGCYDWFPELVQYARKKSVGIIVWVHYTKLDTPEERKVLSNWAAMGIRGIKVDFMDSESQSLIDFYRTLYEECEKYKLLVNPHGANKPTGERQYWPNVINREAVRGEEYQTYLGSDLSTWAFTRGVLGPMDVTPRIVPGENSATSAAAQLAISVHFESGMPCMSSTPETYRKEIGSLFLKDLPSAWEQIEFIDGYPGDYSVLARRSGADWYLSGLTNDERDISISYDFLEEGAEYEAYVFTDSASGETVELEQMTVSSIDEIELHMRANGGFAVKLVKIGGDDGAEDDDGTQKQTEKPTEKPLATEKSTELATESVDNGGKTEEKKGCSSQVFAPAVAVCAFSAFALTLKAKKKKEE